MWGWEFVKLIIYIVVSEKGPSIKYPPTPHYCFNILQRCKVFSKSTHPIDLMQKVLNSTWCKVSPDFPTSETPKPWGLKNVHEKNLEICVSNFEILPKWWKYNKNSTSNVQTIYLCSSFVILNTRNLWKHLSTSRTLDSMQGACALN